MQLDQFLKFTGTAPTGGQAKMMVREGWVRVNGQPELRPGRQLVPGDVVQLKDGDTWTVGDHLRSS